MSAFLAAGRVTDISPVVAQGGLMIHLQLRGRRALVVGGGPVAAQRARLLCAAGAEVTVVAPRVNAELTARSARGELRWEAREVAEDDVVGAAIVMAAIDDHDRSAEIAAWSRAAGVPVNCADLPPLCDFHLPAVHRDGPVQIAVATGGESPGLAARLRDALARALPEGTGEAVRRFGELRRAVRAHDPDPAMADRRMAFLRVISANWPLERIADLDIPAIVQHYPSPMEAPPPRTDDAQRWWTHLHTPAAAEGAGPGRILLVGAGPGDPDLLTLGAARAIAQADLVLSDRLVPDAIRALATGEVRVARKEPGLADAAQAELDTMAIEAARAGRSVVRLKIGDPGIFGRLGEEVHAYEAAGVPCEILPGVSSALAAPELAGVSLTLRGVADRVHVGTGHAAGDGAADLPAWHPTTTYVLLMAVSRLDALVTGLRRAGFPDALPALLVQDASLPGQVVVEAQLDTLVTAARGVRAPAVLILGDVVRWRARATEQPVAQAAAR